MAAEASRSGGGPADSYIGSLISLTSKFEIRYEGVLYNINTEESSIGLRNVRSFGTEGRKDGPQIPPSDKVYEYILFRGSDIKDLQVKSSPPVQTTPPPPPPIHNDPAIIQSHYPRPTSASSSLASVANGTVADPTSHSAQLGLPRSPFQGGLPLYQPGGSFGSWASSAAPQNGSGLPMPMYWQGFYAPSSGLPPLQQQQPLIRPPPGLPIPQSMQQQPMQYPSISMNASSLPTGVPNLIDFTSPLLPPVSNISSTSVTLPSTLAPVQASALTSEALSSMVPNTAPITSLPATTSSANLPLVSPLTSSSIDMNAIVPPISSKPRTTSGPSLAYQTTSQSVSSIIGPSTSGHTEALVPPLVTPGQLLQPGTTTLPSSQPLLTSKDVEAVQPVSSEPSSSAPTEVQAPILPLPRLPDNKMNGAGLQNRHYNRGRERGRGNGVPRGVTQFTEDFDFMAMNEKFNKDEVWGHLGKSKVRDKEGEMRDDDSDDTLEQYIDDSSRFDSKPVYVKDEFFDSLSCNALDQGTRNGRTRFSEQLKIDTETFGDFQRHRGRGGRGPGRGGGRSRGPFYGRGYGYVGRGRGHTMSYRVNYS